MKQLSDKFIEWYLMTHWRCDSVWLDFDKEHDKFTTPETQLLYDAYKSGYNRSKKEIKERETTTP